MKTREVYFKLKYYVGDCSNMMLFYFFKENNIMNMSCTIKMDLCEENDEINIAVMQGIENTYGENFMFWSISNEGIVHQQQNMKVFNSKPILFFCDGDTEYMENIANKMIADV